MNTHFKSFLTGVALGIAPIAVTILINWLIPFFAGKNSDTSFALMGGYALSSLTVFIVAMTLIIVKNKPVTGAVALFLMIFQLIIGVSFI